MRDLKNMSRINRLAVYSDKMFTVFCWAAAILVMLLPMSIFIYLMIHSINVISWEFISQPPKGFPLGTDGGILPAVKGSFQLVSIGLFIAVPFAVCGALYLSEFCRNQRIIQLVRFALDSLAGIPSIVYGLFGYSFLVVFLNFKISLIAGGITLGLIMFPKIFIGTYEAFIAVDNTFRETALAMGVDRGYLIRRVILKKAFTRIVEISVLAAGHAFGTAAPVLITASVVQSYGRSSLFSPVMSLPTHLYYLVGEAVSFEHAYGTAFVMIFLLLPLCSLMMLLKQIQKNRG